MQLKTPRNSSSLINWLGFWRIRLAFIGFQKLIYFLLKVKCSLILSMVSVVKNFKDAIGFKRDIFNINVFSYIFYVLEHQVESISKNICYKANG